MKKQGAFFTQRLIERLEVESPIKVAFEAQVESARVGFDFTTTQLAFDRFTEEVHELLEAKDEFERGHDTVEHLCDEATDVIFSVINVLRHLDIDARKIVVMPSQQRDTKEKQLLLQRVYIAFQSFQEEFQSFKEGDSTKTLLVSVVSLIQKLMEFIDAYGVHSDEAMRRNVRKYLVRCKFIEDQLKEEKKTWSDVPLDEIYKRWKEAKRTDL